MEKNLFLGLNVLPAIVIPSECFKKPFYIHWPQIITLYHKPEFLLGGDGVESTVKVKCNYFSQFFRVQFTHLPQQIPDSALTPTPSQN